MLFFIKVSYITYCLIKYMMPIILSQYSVVNAHVKSTAGHSVTVQVNPTTAPWYSRRLDAAKPASEDAADAVCASRRSRLAGSWLRASATVSDTAADSSCCMHCSRCHRDGCCWVLTHQAREAVVPTFAIIVCPSTPDLWRTCPAELSEYSQIWPWLLAENVLFRVLF